MWSNCFGHSFLFSLTVSYLSRESEWILVLLSEALTITLIEMEEKAWNPLGFHRIKSSLDLPSMVHQVQGEKWNKEIRQTQGEKPEQSSAVREVMGDISATETFMASSPPPIDPPILRCTLCHVQPHESPFNLLFSWSAEEEEDWESYWTKWLSLVTLDLLFV